MTEPNSVVEHVDRGWTELVAFVDSLGPDGLAATGPDGWAVKDHLVHIAAWEHSLIALFEGADRFAAVGVGRDASGTDEINAAVFALHRGKTPEESLAYFRQTHELLMKRLRAMSDEDLQLSYNHYQPNDPRDPSDDRPAVDWVAGNTYEHYAEHIAWMNQLFRSSSASR